MTPSACWRTLALCLVTACALQSPFVWAQSTPATQRLPHMGDGNNMSIAQERRLGESIMRQLVTDGDYLDDPVLIGYLQGVWQSLRVAARQLGQLQPELDEAFSWDVLLVRDKSVNAFALPGGFMGVHLGLIAAVSNRDELASVMGHELSHVSQRHIARMQEQQGRQTPWLVGAMIVGVLAASRSPDAANAMIMGGTASVAQNQLNFSRDMEREADRLGFNVLTQAGFEPQGMVGMFQKLAQASRLNDSGGYPYLRSHPLTTERMADMQSRIGPNLPPAATTSLEHAMMGARARALLATRVDDAQLLTQSLVRDWTPDLPPAKQAALLYAGVMAHAQLGQANQARDAMARLMQLTASDPAARQAAQWLAADTERRLGVPSACSSKLTPEVSERAHELLLAQCRLDMKQLESAQRTSERLQLWVGQYPRDPLAWDLLSQAHAQMGNRLQSLRADAESRVARWDEQGAIDRLHAAQMLSKTMAKEGRLDRAGQMEASIIDARLRAIEALRRELLRPQN